MSVRLYFDVHVPIAIADALRLRNVDVLRAQEGGAAEFEDPQLLDRATELNPVLFTQDKGFFERSKPTSGASRSIPWDCLCSSTQCDDWRVCERP